MEPSTGEMTRRKFMSAAIASIGGLISAALGLPAIAYIISPALKKQVEDWVRLGAINKVELGTPTLFKTSIERQTGWITDQEEISAYVLTEDGQNYIAMSNICTHLGCRARWIEEQAQFFCPCHNGVFSKDGSVVSGPPPRPLDRFETKVEDGTLFIRKG
ncbi:MAG TPA: ubiquinol-cytochrome c reductase iron-sulfur subunit [Anaerolineales bacterium]|nr:ubiquinol-cytochrome c reductase iron-sulfur subunit [Anaerolineales bacterium]